MKLGAPRSQTHVTAPLLVAAEESWFPGESAYDRSIGLLADNMKSGEVSLGGVTVEWILSTLTWPQNDFMGCGGKRSDVMLIARVVVEWI